MRPQYLNQTIQDQFNDLDKLELVKFNRVKGHEGVIVSGDPEVIVLLSNHNPRSRALLAELNEIEESPDFKLRFFAASFAGYGMHDSSMMDLAEFKERVASYLK
jgi:hypothetical protein